MSGSWRHIAAAGLLLGASLLGVGCARTLDVPSMVPSRLDDGFVRVTDCFKSQHPAGDWVQTWISRDAETAWRAGGPLPVGTTFVKAQFRDARCKDSSRYTAMRKGPAGTAPASGDWIWQLVDRDHGVRQAGQLPGCIGCHKVCEDEGYLCTWPAPPPAPEKPAQPPLPDDF